MARVGPRFARRESFGHACDLVTGMMSALPRKNCWTVAEHVGDPVPYGLQNLLSRASWDHDGVRDDLRGYVIEHLGDPGGILVADETGDLKKGTATVGVQRQYTGTAGRIENAQVAVHLTYTSSAGHAMIDAELYLPESWTSAPARLAAAGVPDDVGFATKPQLAAQMINRALDAGTPASWVTADEVYGTYGDLRAELEARRVGYVLAVACDHRIRTPAGKQRVDGLAARLPRLAWQERSAGAGAKGPRLYQWALIDILAHDTAHDTAHDPPDGHRWLLIRRNRTTGELAYYRCYAPGPVPLRTLVTVAGRRWTVEESFQAGKGLCGLDEHQVRTWTSWRRWAILSMLAFAFLAVQTTRERTTPAPGGMIPLTCNEIAHLINTHTAADRDHHLRWSQWRRRHQHTARHCHYQQRQASHI